MGLVEIEWVIPGSNVPEIRMDTGSGRSVVVSHPPPHPPSQGAVGN